VSSTTTTASSAPMIQGKLAMAQPNTLPESQVEGIKPHR
jgi:hypothetical protein